MPPRFNVTPQVQEQQLPGARMAPVPQGQFDTRQAVHNLEIVREQHDQMAFYDAMKAMTDLKQWENKSGYESVLGENARELPKRMQSEYQKRASELAESLQNPRARAMFQRKADANEVAFLGAVEHHSLRQKTIAEAQKTDAFVSTWQDAGVKAGSSGNYADMEAAAGEIDGARRIWGQANGVPQVAVDRMIKQDTSRIYIGAITSMLDTKRDQAAKAALEMYGDRIPERERAKLAGMVQEESTLGAAYREVDKIYSTYYTDVQKEGETEVVAHYAPETEEDAVEEARKIKDPAVRAKAESLARERWHGHVRSQEAQRKKLLIDAANQIDGGAKFDDLPATLRESMTHTEKKSMRAYAQKDPTTDDATWYSLKLMGSHEQTRDQFIDLNLMSPQFLTSLSKSDRQEMANWQADLRQKKSKAMDDARGFLTANGIVSAADDKIPSADRPAFSRIASEQMRLWKVRNKAEHIPEKDMIDIVDSLLKPVRKERRFLWDTDQPMYKTLMVSPTAESDAKVDEILTDAPSADIQKITSDFKARGIPMTRFAIYDAYKALEEKRKREGYAGK